MRRKIFMTLFMLYNISFAQSKQEITINFNNIIIENNGKNINIKKSSKIIYNYDDIREDVLLVIDDEYYHLKKATPNERGVTKSNKEYKFATYIGNTGRQFILQSFDDIKEGVRLIFTESFAMRLY